MTKENNYRTGEVTQLRRIADALEEVLRLVKEDQERSRKYMEKDSEQKTRVRKYSGPDQPLALASGPGPKLQATSGKLQASSSKLDKVTLQ